MRGSRLAVELAGLLAFAGGVIVLRQTDIGGDPMSALAAIATQASVTVPAAILVLGAAVLNLAAGAVLMRLLSGSPYAGVAQAALAGLVGAVILDLGLLATLGSVGLFSWPFLLVANLAVLALGLRTRPVLTRAAVQPWSIRESPLALVLIVLVWSSPILLQLASPVVPFFDVLPNHVAPVEHIRTFAGLSALDITPSPIFGPSRIFLGFEAVLGNASAITTVPAVTAVAAFALPMTLLLAAAAWGLASSVAGARAGVWALLLVPLSLAFLHLPDARAAVLVWPIIAFAVWLLVEPLGMTRLRRAVLLTAALTAATYVHPLQGFMCAVGVGLALLLIPRLRRDVSLFPPAVAVILAAPQWATMAGLALPTWSLLLTLPLAAVIWFAATHARLPATGLLDRRWMPAAVSTAFAIVVAALVAGTGAQQFLVVALAGAASSAVLTIGALHSALIARDRRDYVLLWVVPAAALLGALVASALPMNTELGQSIAYEVPKTTNYLVWPFLGVSAAVGLAALWERVEWPQVVRAAICGIFLVAAAAPIRLGIADPLTVGEHRLSEVATISWRTAADGYWQGYPDPRTLIDQPQADVITALRGEIDAGRLGADTPVLHVAATFQAWGSIPLSVFAGVDETMASLDPEVSIHTAGGRLHSVDELPTLLGGGLFPYVVFEPAGLSPSTADQIAAAGYQPIFTNSRAEILVRN